MRLLRRTYLSSIRKKDELEAIVPRRFTPLFWPTMLTFSIAITGFVAWLLLGTLPVNVNVKGVVIPLGGVREIATNDSGIVSWQGAQVGDDVRAGELLFKVRNVVAETSYLAARETYLANSLALDRERLAVREEQKHSAARLTALRSATQEQLSASRLVEQAMDKAVDQFLERKLAALNNEYGTSQTLNELVNSFNDGLEKLAERGVVSQRQVIQNLERQAIVERSFSQVDIDIIQTDLEEQRFQIELNSIREKISRLEIEISRYEDEIVDGQNLLSLKLAELDASKLSLVQTLLQAEQRYWHASNVYAPYDGSLLATNRGVAQAVGTSESIALINLSSQEQKLLLIISPRAFSGSFDLAINDKSASVELPAVSDHTDLAKKIQSALVRILGTTHVSVEARGHDRFVIGADDNSRSELLQLRLADVRLEDAGGLSVFSSLLEIGDSWSPKHLINVGIVSEKNAKRIRPGAKTHVKPDYEPAMIGAEITGRIETVSTFVQTSLQIEGLIGSSELSQQLLASQRGAIVTIALDQTEDGNPLWVRGPPEHPLSIGTTTESRIQVGSVSPFRVLVPFIANLFDL